MEECGPSYIKAGVTEYLVVLLLIKDIYVNADKDLKTVNLKKIVTTIK